MHRVSKYWFFALLAAFCTFPVGATPLRVTLESNAIVTSAALEIILVKVAEGPAEERP